MVLNENRKMLESISNETLDRIDEIEKEQTSRLNAIMSSKSALLKREFFDDDKDQSEVSAKKSKTN
jgi:hypothetical protein